MNKFNLLIIIPARKGSKRLPFKNKLLLGGKTLTERAVEAASIIGKELRKESKIIITSNDDEILAMDYGMREVILEKRDESLSQDATRMIDVMKNILARYGDERTLVVLLQPTTPFRNAKRMAKYISLVFDKEEIEDRCIIATKTCQVKPAHIYSRQSDKTLTPLLKEQAGKSINAQELGRYFELTGGLYAFWRDAFIRTGKIINGKIYNYRVCGKYSIDIDGPKDMELAKKAI